MRSNSSASPGSNAGCGLKPRNSRLRPGQRRGITRQQCRVWIETSELVHAPEIGEASPGSNAGCGLKLVTEPGCVADFGITRQQCRVWIETWMRSALRLLAAASPGSNAGCGLKPVPRSLPTAPARASPGSNAGCGLKQGGNTNHAPASSHHPAAMPGVD